MTAASIAGSGAGMYLAMDGRPGNDPVSIGLGITSTVGIVTGSALTLQARRPAPGVALALLGGTLAATMGANYLGWRLAARGNA